MPWYLSLFGRNGQPDWAFADPELSKAFMQKNFLPDPALLPIKVQLARARKSLPDITVGPWTSMVVVSDRFRALVEAMDPVEHLFIGLDVRQPDDGAVVPGHHIFRLRGLLPLSIDLDGSDIVETVLRPGLTVYGPTSQVPRITWRQSIVADRHIWADAKLPGHLAVSDAFHAAMKAQDMTDFLAVEGRFGD
jgi:hypothetical protein